MNTTLVPSPALVMIVFTSWGGEVLRIVDALHLPGLVILGAYRSPPGYTGILRTLARPATKDRPTGHGTALFWFPHPESRPFRFKPLKFFRSVSTKITELARADSLEEREKPEGQDRGFMWRLNSYWRYEEVNGGLVIEGESMLLSRDIPRGLRVFVDPLIDRSAHEMIENTLVRIRRRYSADELARAR